MTNKLKQIISLLMLTILLVGCSTATPEIAGHVFEADLEKTAQYEIDNGSEEEREEITQDDIELSLSLAEYLDIEIFFNEETEKAELSIDAADIEGDSDMPMELFFIIAMIEGMAQSNEMDLDYSVNDEEDVLYLDGEAHTIEWDGKNALQLTSVDDGTAIFLNRQ